MAIVIGLHACSNVYHTTLGPVYWHVPFLFKPGPSLGAFTPIVSANSTMGQSHVGNAPIHAPSYSTGCKQRVGAVLSDMSCHILL